MIIRALFFIDPWISVQGSRVAAPYLLVNLAEHPCPTAMTKDRSRSWLRRKIIDSTMVFIRYRPKGTALRVSEPFASLTFGQHLTFITP